MRTRSPQRITDLLVAWSAGDESALEQLAPLVHSELHRLAHQYMARERPDHTSQTSALVNEAYMRLIEWKNVRWQNRAHFFAVSAQLMRRILVDFARDRRYLKRGGATFRVSLNEASDLSMQHDGDLVALDEAPTSLAEVDKRKCEVAEVLKVSEETVTRDWRLAKVWLLRELSSEKPSES